MARLLVSVRSAAEAALAVRAGADIIDVKEPDLGSLGRASVRVWQDVRQACPSTVPVSVALGELNDWRGDAAPTPPPEAWSGLSFRKLGLAGVGPNWPVEWASLRSRPDLRPGPPWIAVAYADWKSAGAPSPDAVLEAASDATEIAGVLVDTWSKGKPFRLDDSWSEWTRRVRRANLLLAIAGSLDLAGIRALCPIRPDIVAVRGAACVDGRRNSAIDPGRVSGLVRCVATLPR